MSKSNRQRKNPVLCPFCSNEYGEYLAMTDELEPKVEGRVVLVCSVCRHCYCVTGEWRERFSCGCMRCQEAINPLGAEFLRNQQKIEKEKISPEGQAQLEELRKRLERDFFGKPVEVEKPEEPKTCAEVDEQRKRVDEIFGEEYKRFCEALKKAEGQKRKKP